MLREGPFESWIQTETDTLRIEADSQPISDKHQESDQSNLPKNLQPEYFSK